MHRTCCMFGSCLHYSCRTTAFLNLHKSEDMPDRVPEDMPDKMPEDMSDRMPEDLPVTKRIDVMVGITRSNVFFRGI